MQAFGATHFTCFTEETSVTEPSVLADKAGSAAYLVLNRPASINALDHEMVLEMARLLEEWADDDTVKSVVVSGAGERGFCAGAKPTKLARYLSA